MQRSSTGLITSLLGGASGFASGLWLAWLIPQIAVARGGSPGSVMELSAILAPAGAALGVLLVRLLLWAHGGSSSPSRAAAMLPWSASLLPLIVFILPDVYFRQNITLFGGTRYILAAAWLLGSAIHTFFLLKPIAATGAPLKLAAVWTLAAMLISFPVATQPPNKSDEGDYIAAAIAIAEDGSTRVLPVVTSGRLERFYFNHLPPTWECYAYVLKHFPEDANEYSYRMAGYPLILAPFVTAAKHLEEPAARWWITCLPGLSAYFLLVYAIATFLKRSGAGGGHTIVAYATMMPLLFYSASTQPEIFMASAMAGSLLLLDEYISGRRGPVGFGMVVTLSMLLHERMAFLALPLAAFALYYGRSRGRLLLTCAVCMIPVLFSYASTFQFMLPDQLPHAYGQKSMRFFDPARWIDATIQHIFSIRFGLLTHIPPLIALGSYLMKGESGATPPGEKNTQRAALAAFALYSILILTYPHSFFSFPHVRYMVPALPLLAPFLCIAIARLETRTWGIRMVSTLIVIQLLMDWAYLSVPPLWRVIHELGGSAG